MTAHPPAPFDAHIAFCYTADLEATDRFYRGLLGLQLSLDQGSCRIYRVTDSAHLGFCTREGAAAPDGVILCLVTADVDGWAATLRASGARLEKEPAHDPRYSIYHCLVRDPNGYLVEIQRFDDPRWLAAVGSTTRRRHRLTQRPEGWYDRKP